VSVTPIGIRHRHNGSSTDTAPKLTMLILLLLQVFCLDPSLITLNTVSWPRKDPDNYTPKLWYRGKYSYSGGEGDYGATFHALTKYPTINLDNYESIKKVRCHNGKMFVVFTSIEKAKKAASVWTKADNLTVVSGHETASCGGPQSVSFIIRSISLHDAIISMNVEVVLWKNLIREYNIKISQMIDNTLEKRDLRKKIALKFNMNYNPETGAAKKETVDLLYLNARNSLNQKLVDIRCYNCSATGYMSIEMNIVGTALSVKRYDFSVKGNVKVSFGLDMVMKAGLPIPDFSHKIIPTIPLGGIRLPGVASIGPKIDFLALGTIQVQKNIILKDGFDLNVPLDVRIYSQNGIDKPPNITKTGVPEVSRRATSLEMPELFEFRVGAGIMPKLGLEVSVFSFSAIDVSFAWPSMLLTEWISCVKSSLEETTRWSSRIYATSSFLFSVNLGKWISATFPISKSERTLKCNNCNCEKKKVFTGPEKIEDMCLETMKESKELVNRIAKGVYKAPELMDGSKTEYL
jgi:hypothetical protein